MTAAIRAYQMANDAFDQAFIDRLGLNRTDGRCKLIWEVMGPFVEEATKDTTRFSARDLEVIRDFLIDARRVTERHTARLREETPRR